MKLLYLSIIYSLLLINIPTYSVNEKEYNEYINQIHEEGALRDWVTYDVHRVIHSYCRYDNENKKPSQLADFFKRNDVPIMQFERNFPNDRYEQNYHTAAYIFLKSNYAFKEFLKDLKKACST